MFTYYGNHTVIGWNNSHEECFAAFLLFKDEVSPRYYMYRSPEDPKESKRCINYIQYPQEKINYIKT